MKKTLVIAGSILLGFIILVIGLALISGNDTKKVETVKVPHASLYENTIEDEFKDGFIEGCAEEGATVAQCTCSYNLLIDELGFDGVMNMSIEYINTEELPLKLLSQIVEECY